MNGLVEIVEIPSREWDEKHFEEHGLPEIAFDQLDASFKQPAFVFGKIKRIFMKIK